MSFPGKFKMRMFYDDLTLFGNIPVRGCRCNIRAWTTWRSRERLFLSLLDWSDSQSQFLQKTSRFLLKNVITYWSGFDNYLSARFTYGNFFLWHLISLNDWVRLTSPYIEHRRELYDKRKYRQRRRVSRRCGHAHYTAFLVGLIPGLHCAV